MELHKINELEPVRGALMDVGVNETGFWWICGAMFAAIGAAFGWGQKSIGDAKRELRGEMEDIRDVIRNNQDSANAYREQMLVRLGEVPTRNDLREALREHESRITRQIESMRNGGVRY